jgi:glycosyltransferase involved in cell wall biosynthesis
MKISVALCTYNGEKFLHQQIDSILTQTTEVDEIIICDDRSTDETQKILHEYKNQFPEIFKIYINEENLRSVKNFEKAISLCSGDIIFLSDQDDVWEENKVDVYLKYFNQNLNIEVICSNGFIINENGNKLEKYTVWDVPILITENNQKIDYFKIFNTIGNFATGAAMAIRKSFADKILPFPMIENFHHDEWIAVVSAEQQKFAFLNEKLFSYRTHNNQQVGGISYPKDDNSKQKIIQRFDVNREPKTFRDFKIKIRTLRDKEKKFQQYLENHKNPTVGRLLSLVKTEKADIIHKMKIKNPIFSLFFKYLY